MNNNITAFVSPHPCWEIACPIAPAATLTRTADVVEHRYFQILADWMRFRDAERKSVGVPRNLVGWRWRNIFKVFEGIYIIV